MSDLGDFLENFYGPNPTFRTVRALMRHTRKTSSSAQPSRRGPVIGRRRTGRKMRDDLTEILSLWAVPPDQLRIETSRVTAEQPQITIEVFNREGAWELHSEGTVEQRRRRPHRMQGCGSLPPTYERHFDRGLIRRFFAALTLEASGKVHLAARDCLRIRAVQVPGTQLWPHWLAWEADEFEFVVDVERAIILSILGRVASEVVESHEVLEIAFDEDLDESLFNDEPGPNEAMIPFVPAVEYISLEGARARAPFSVLTPHRLPESERIQCETTYHAARPDSPVDCISIHYRGGKTFQHLWITERPMRDARMQEELDWCPLEVGGRLFEVSDPSPEEGLRVVAFEQNGTYVDIVSDLTIATLLDLATSFEVVDG